MDIFFDKKTYNLFKNNTHPDAFIIENYEETIIPIETTRSLKKFLNSTDVDASATNM